ncbi:hypothetical protein Taro_003007, partial [Colocasia esculenta]|nr:hypothetical protein [Colocasia esculenta]
MHMVAFRCSLCKQTITVVYGCIQFSDVSQSECVPLCTALERSGETERKANRQEGVKNNLVIGQIGSGEEGGKWEARVTTGLVTAELQSSQVERGSGLEFNWHRMHYIRVGRRLKNSR